MNQWIKIEYKPEWHSNPNHWNFWFCLNYKQHREKAPSFLNSPRTHLLPNGNWNLYIQGKFQKRGRDSDWGKS